MKHQDDKKQKTRFKKKRETEIKKNDKDDNPDDYKKKLRQFSDRDNKALLIDRLPLLLENNSQDHSIFFVTFTFQNSRLADEVTDYKRFFIKFWCDLNKRTRSSSSKKDQYSKLILVPERSTFNDKKMPFKQRHYHGALLIPKKQEEKFKRNCVNALEFDETVQKEKLILRPEILAPFAKNNQMLEIMRQVRLENKILSSSELSKMNRAEFLNVQSHAIYKINDTSEFYATCYYSGKKFAASEFVYDDALFLTKS